MRESILEIFHNTISRTALAIFALAWLVGVAVGVHYGTFSAVVK